jgi:hypothetical protein
VAKGNAAKRGYLLANLQTLKEYIQGAKDADLPFLEGTLLTEQVGERFIMCNV